MSWIGGYKSKNKAAEEREKMEREGKGFSLDGNDNPRYMTELEHEIMKIDKR